MLRPVAPISPDVCDAARIVGVTGQFVVPRDPAALAAAIKLAAELSVDVRRDHGLQARARIAASFTRALAIDAYTRLYHENTAGPER